VRFERLLLLGFTVTVVQLTVGNLARIGSASPDLLFLLAAWMAFHSKAEDALPLAWVAGLIKDCASTADFGSFGFLFALASLLVTTLKDALFRDALWVQVALVFAGGLLYNSCYGLWLAHESGPLDWSWALDRAWRTAMYTAACAPVMFALFDPLKGYLRLER